MLLQTAALGQDYLYGRGGRRNFPGPALLEQFQEKCAAVFRPELRQKGEQFQEKCAAVFRPELRQKGEQFQEKCAAVFRPELRQKGEQFQESAQRFSVRNCGNERLEYCRSGNALDHDVLGLVDLKT
ncbi:hypothetical protein M8037_09180 [Sinorhizobium meliloti]|uniref:hypothetical protein n=1 Tax=Rhizobium meliloti TaxID=382 RepID=UPI00140219CB|nr:hypothetical protein [Sinorhizobium meliloti]MCM5688976.1 hypothetical protein [Sinorhizobium meliloti]